MFDNASINTNLVAKMYKHAHAGTKKDRYITAGTISQNWVAKCCYHKKTSAELRKHTWLHDFPDKAFTGFLKQSYVVQVAT